MEGGDRASVIESKRQELESYGTLDLKRDLECKRASKDIRIETENKAPSK